MALRLFPFRQYSDHNVINMFANQTVDDNPSTDGNGSAGVIVKVFTGGGVPGGSISKDVIEFASSSSYLGKTDYPFLEPINTLKLLCELAQLQPEFRY